MAELLDCIVIGGGPGGLTAGIYLQRYRRNIVVIDNAQSRARLIPTSHNYPGFPEGISGIALLERLQRQYVRYDGLLLPDTVLELKKFNNEFEVVLAKESLHARKVIVATGVTDIEPSLPNLKDMVKEGFIHHCAICDAYEIKGQNVAVIGTGTQGIKEALFLRSYTSAISLLTLGKGARFSSEQKRLLAAANINIITDPLKEIRFNEDKSCCLVTLSGQTCFFDTVYSALGSIIKSDLAIKVGAKNSGRYIKVNHHQETTVIGLFAVGDVVFGLNQICVATAQGAIAATHIHNQLNDEQRKALLSSRA